MKLKCWQLIFPFLFFAIFAKAGNFGFAQNEASAFKKAHFASSHFQNNSKKSFFQDTAGASVQTELEDASFPAILSNFYYFPKGSASFLAVHPVWYYLPDSRRQLQQQLFPFHFFW